MSEADFQVLGMGPEVGNTKECSYLVGPFETCGVIAVVHAAVTVRADNVTACKRHWPDLKKNLEPIQWHPIAEDCGVPGSVWNFDENRCEFNPFDDHAGLLEREAVAS